MMTVFTFCKKSFGEYFSFFPFSVKLTKAPQINLQDEDIELRVTGFVFFEY